jgi:protein-disulfide isomerase
MSKPLRVALTLLCLVAFACAPAGPPIVPNTPSVPIAAVAAVAPAQAVAIEPEIVDDGDPGPIPVTAADPWRGRRDAPVTIVELGDFQCPFCSRAETTLSRLRDTYGPEKLRIVWKNNPLPFHNDARPAAVAAMALFERLGNDAFWQAHDAFYADQAHLKDVVADAAARAGTSLDELRVSASWARAEAKVAADMTLAKDAGATGTPSFFINGVLLVGAQPYEKFAAAVDEQLQKAKDLVARGTPRWRVYAELSKAQKGAAPPPSAPSKPADEDRTVWQVPVGKSPVRGKATALVTLVEWADFQCPFCGRVTPTVKKLEAEYGDKLRVVFKHEPLPFHPRAEPAAELALEARAQRGDRGFWAAHDLLFGKECAGAKGDDRQSCMDAGGTWMDHQTQLDDTDLLGYAKALGLDVGKVQAAIAGKKHAATIAADQELSEDLQASGTPHFFVNGRRLVGAQPIEKFRAVIDEELVKAQQMVKQGVAPAQVYEKILATAKGPPLPDRKTVPAPTRANPSRGPGSAKVVVQMFADFQCPFCKRSLQTIGDLEKAFPGKIRVVWMNLPLPMHKDAALAAEAAMEAFRQKGDAGFWAMHALLFANQDASGGLERPALDGYAAQIGLDAAQFSAALDTRAHKPEVDADAKIAQDAQISGTPGFVINGYFVSGAQPLGKFRRIVERALGDADKKGASVPAVAKQRSQTW